jgi:FtsX-like permease family protein/MacB-like protein
MKAHSGPSHSGVWAALQVALHDIRSYWGTALLLAAAGAVALAAALPVTSLVSGGPEGLRNRLGVPALPGGDLGLHWNMGMHPPAVTQQRAVDALGGMLLGTACATLAIAAVTILILSATREAEREDEIAMRRAVGARHAQVLLSALLEGALLAIGAVVVGASVGLVIGPIALVGWPGRVHAGSIAGSAVVVALVVAGTLVLGISFPAIMPRRRVGQMVGPIRMPLAPSAIQMAAGLIALTISALVVRAASELARPGQVQAESGSVFSLALGDTTPAERARRYAELLRGLERREGMGTVSLSSPGALVGLGPVGLVTTDCGQCSEGGIFLITKTKPATHQLVSSDTFRLLNLRLLAGRGISAGDDWDAPRVAVVSRSLAAREFQKGEAIGRQIRVIDDGVQWSTVVGIVDDPVPTGLGGPLQPRYTVYLSVLQHPPSTADLLVRGPPARDTGPAVRPVMQATLGRRLTRLEHRSEPALLAADAAPLRWFARWFGIEGWAMLGITTLGTFALMLLWVRSLRVELGVRRAVGAHRRHLFRLVLLRAAAVGLTGILAGLWFGPSIWGVLPSVMTGFHAWDPHPVARYAVLLLASALAGALLPAWRAARMTPASLIASH